MVVPAVTTCDSWVCVCGSPRCLLLFITWVWSVLIVCWHTRSQERNLVLCCLDAAAHCLYVFMFFVVFEVMDTRNAEAHTLRYILDSMTSHIMDQPEVCGCTAGFSTHAVRWSRQPAS